jgi:hypothetical protein
MLHNGFLFQTDRKYCNEYVYDQLYGRPTEWVPIEQSTSWQSISFIRSYSNSRFDAFHFVGAIDT